MVVSTTSLSPGCSSGGSGNCKVGTCSSVSSAISGIDVLMRMMRANTKSLFKGVNNFFLLCIFNLLLKLCSLFLCFLPLYLKPFKYLLLQLIRGSGDKLSCLSLIPLTQKELPYEE